MRSGRIRHPLVGIHPTDQDGKPVTIVMHPTPQSPCRSSARDLPRWPLISCRHRASTGGGRLTSGLSRDDHQAHAFALRQLDQRESSSSFCRRAGYRIMAYGGDANYTEPGDRDQARAIGCSAWGSSRSRPSRRRQTGGVPRLLAAPIGPIPERPPDDGRWGRSCPPTPSLRGGALTVDAARSRHVVTLPTGGYSPRRTRATLNSGKVKLWDTKTGEPVVIPACPGRKKESFSPWRSRLDGKMLAGSSSSVPSGRASRHCRAVRDLAEPSRAQDPSRPLRPDHVAWPSAPDGRTLRRAAKIGACGSRTWPTEGGGRSADQPDRGKAPAGSGRSRIRPTHRPWRSAQRLQPEL